ncbi:MAG: hypothetical protein IPH95_22400 [Candidatus Promineofilum sp.]|nr:hypothetical protein [Promineifilum sp.]
MEQSEASQPHALIFCACEAFFDPFLIVLEDVEAVGDELREKLIGMTAAAASTHFGQGCYGVGKEAL